MLKVFLLCGALLFPAAAFAQVSMSATVMSDYRYRGLTLSDDRPALQGGLAWEHASGWFAGTMATSTRIAGTSGLQWLSYVGHVTRLDSGLGLEAGAQHIAFSRSQAGSYQEVFAGIASEQWSARLYYQAPAMGAGGHGVYLEANGTRALGERVQLLGHLGWNRRPDTADRDRFDARIGIGMLLGDFAAQLAYVVHDGSSADGDPYATPYGEPRYAAPNDTQYDMLYDDSRDDDALVLSVSRGW